MKFAEPLWLLGALLSVLVLAFYVLGGLGLVKALNRFGDREPVSKLLTARAGGMRALKSGLVVISVAIAFVALAGPQYGRGTRLIPATNLDCVIVLDYSKSMYARDVPPNRSERAKAEVSQLIAELPGARFGAVAFAGEPLSFPLTSDGGAIAQFFRQTSPNDMPIGGTAIARALEAARELLERDPLSKKHQKVIVLVTDGEDLEGDPVQVAELARKDGILTHVVQIGSRAPEAIPEVNEQGVATGIRRDSQGKPLMTSLSAEGEEQLTKIAQAGGGVVVRAQAGQTGITEIAQRLKVLMTEELAEKVETLYADVFHYPLALALALLFAEVFVPVVRRRRRSSTKSIGTVGILSLLMLSSGCESVEKQLFSRHSPAVDEAVAAIRTRDAGTAKAVLSEYLSTGQCKEGSLGVPAEVKELPYASLDLGLALFQLAERYGKRFGEEAPPEAEADPNAQGLLVKRGGQIDCALRLVRVIAADTSAPLALRAQAYYLSGNLEFLRYDYAAAISSYDSVLELSPGGLGDAGSTVGTDAAFNRAIAQRRLEEQEKDKPPQDAGPPPPSDAGSGEQNEDQDQKDQDQKDQDQKDQDQKDQDQKDQDQKDQDQKDQDQKDQDQKDQDQKDQNQEGSQDTSQPQEQEPPQTAPQATASPSLSQDDRMLDQLERAPMFQHAQPQGERRGRGRTNMEDK